MATGKTSARVMVTMATTMATGETSARVMVTMGKRIHNELPHLAKLIVRTVQFGPAEPFFPSLCCIYRGAEQSWRSALFWPLGKENIMTLGTNNLIRKLRKAAQPPLSHPGATPDSDGAKKPPLTEPLATDQELNPGDRVERLG